MRKRLFVLAAILRGCWPVAELHVSSIDLAKHARTLPSIRNSNHQYNHRSVIFHARGKGLRWSLSCPFVRGGIPPNRFSRPNRSKLTRIARTGSFRRENLFRCWAASITGPCLYDGRGDGCRPSVCGPIDAGFSQMKHKRHSVDQIVSELRKADVELGKGKKVPEVCKELEVTEQTYYRWRQKYGGMQPVMVKQLKSL